MENIQEEIIKGDRVISYCKSSLNWPGVARRVSDKAVHVEFDNGFYQKFHFKPSHHMQSSIYNLKLVQRKHLTEIKQWKTTKKSGK